MQNAAKVGLLLVVFIGLLIGGYSVLGKNLLAPKADVYYVRLNDAGGLSEGTRVLIAGVDVGTITHVQLDSPTEAKLTLGLTPGTKIPRGSVLDLPTTLIGFGDSPVSIVPPITPVGGDVAVGATLEGKKEGALEGFAPGAGDTLKQLNLTLVAMRKLLEDEKLKNKVSDLLVSSNKTIDRFGAVADSVNRLIATNQSQIGHAMAAATAAVTDVHKMTSKIAELVQSGKLQKDAVAIMDQVKTITQHADKLVVDMRDLVNDPRLREPMDKAAANVAQITDTGKEIAANTAAMTKNGVAISANVGEVSKKAITLTDKAIDLEDRATKIEDQLKGVLDKVGGFFSKAPGSQSLPKITSEMDLIRQSNPGYWRTDFNVSFPLSDNVIHLGVYDAFESNQLTAQLGKAVNSRLSYRYGMYASKPGVGVDYALAPRLALRGDAWNINNPRLDLRANYEFGNGLIGWFGFDQVLKANAIEFGLGVRR